VNADPDANGTSIPTGVSDIGQFSFSAAANQNSKNGLNKVTFTDLIFNVLSTNIQMGSGYYLYNKANSSVKSPCYVVDSVSSPYFVACWNIPAANVQSAIDPGTAATFVLQGTILNPKVSGSRASVLQVSLQHFSDASQIGMSSGSSHIRWLDKDSGSSESQFWWIDFPDSMITSTTYQG
jgi:hypothetical protein